MSTSILEASCAWQLYDIMCYILGSSWRLEAAFSEHKPETNQVLRLACCESESGSSLHIQSERDQMGGYLKPKRAGAPEYGAHVTH
jgi:hypothetical protein